MSECFGVVDWACTHTGHVRGELGAQKKQGTGGFSMGTFGTADFRISTSCGMLVRA